jgi:hypothetical protein
VFAPIRYSRVTFSTAIARKPALVANSAAELVWELMLFG